MKKEREPLKTFGEMAAEFGVSQNTLVGMLAADKTDNKPKSVFGRKRTATGGQARYYTPSEMRAWFHSRTPAAITNAIWLLQKHGYTVQPPNVKLSTGQRREEEL